jgi:hypothetical protein
MSEANTESTQPTDDDMPAELDFSKLGKGVRGLHYLGPNVTVSFPPDPVPVYLDHTVQAWLTAKAASKGLSPDDIANQLLKRDIEVIEAMK